MKNESFDKISNALDTSFKDDSQLEDVKNDIAIINEKKEELKNNLEDKDFMTSELKTLILSARTVLHKLESDIKVGCNGRQYEVYAKMNDSITNTLKELRELNLTIHTIKKDNNELNINDIGENKIPFTSNQILELIDKARDNSEMNKIDATFKVRDDITEEK